MNKKAFTLIELIGVIILIAVIALITYPIITNLMTSSKEKAYQEQVRKIEEGAEAWVNYKQINQENISKTDITTVTIDDLIREGFIKKTEIGQLKDPRDNSVMKGCVAISYSTEYNQYLYQYDTTCSVLDYVDNSGASKPELVEKMIPVIYKDNNWVYADKTQKWYDYDAKEWANAVVLNSGATKNVGDTIAESEIAMMYVWIPRYEYILPTASLGITGTPNAIDIKFIDSTKTNADSGYSIHPGFTFGTSNKNGIWFGKFESSTIGNVDSNSVQTIVIKPNVISWRSVNPANIFTSSRNVQTEYGLTGVDTHMARYLEWTTASYLTNSIYGRCSNATSCTEVSRNDSSSYYTGRSDGTNGSGTTSSANGTYTYETANGQLASTTGNIYGIYDMSGGAYEYVMGVAANTSETVFLGGRNATSPSGFIGSYGEGGSASSGTAAPGSQYYDVFTSTNTSTNNYSVLSLVNGNSSMNGVFKELMGSNSSANYNWYNDYAYFVYVANPWFVLGGYYSNNAHAGVFSSDYSNGNADSDCSFRVVLLSN